MKKTVIAAAIVLVCAAAGNSADRNTTVIEFWEGESVEMRTLFDRLIADFEKRHQGITVKRTHVEGTDLRREFTSGTIGVKGPDLLHVPNGEIAGFVAQNRVAPVAEIMGERFLSDFTRSAVEASTYNGKAYMVPDRDGNELCLIMNRDLVAKAPESFEELVAAGNDLRKKGKIAYPLVFNMVQPYFSAVFLGAFGGAVFDNPQSDKAMPTFSTESVTEWCRFLRTLQQDSVIPLMADYDTASTLFKEGKAAFILNGSWSFDDYIYNADMHIAVAPIPAINGRRPAPYSAVKGYMVPSSVKKSAAKCDAVKAFIAFMTSKKAQLALCAVPDILPSRSDALKDKLIAADPLRAPRAAQLEFCRPLPIAPQMSAVWEGMTAVQANLFSGKTPPEKAAAQMQRRVVDGMRALGIAIGKGTDVPEVEPDEPEDASSETGKSGIERTEIDGETVIDLTDSFAGIDAECEAEGAEFSSAKLFTLFVESFFADLRFPELKNSCAVKKISGEAECAERLKIYSQFDEYGRGKFSIAVRFDGAQCYDAVHGGFTIRYLNVEHGKNAILKTTFSTKRGTGRVFEFACPLIIPMNSENAQRLREDPDAALGFLFTVEKTRIENNGEKTVVIRAEKPRICGRDVYYDSRPPEEPDPAAEPAEEPQWNPDMP